MIDKFLKNLSSHPCSLHLKNSKIGLEKESLRVDKNGTISYKMHPKKFGSSLTNKFITTDYSEALLEMVTPPCSSNLEAINYLENIIAYVYENLEDEYLWPASMPCIIAGEKSIPIAYYGTSNPGRMKTTYRRGLGNRYGRIMQVISGIHYNYSFCEKFWEQFSAFKKSNKEIKDFKSEQYFITSRNLLRNGWVIPYLFGCSPAVCKSYLSGKKNSLESFDEYTYYEKYATSLRMGDIGYQNNKEEDMGVHIDYNSLKNYVKSLNSAIKKNSGEYEKIGVFSEGYYKQINSNILQIENEYYSTVRPKPNPNLELRPSKGLNISGVDYIELRSIDNNIFSKAGIDINQMYFTELLIMHSLFSNDSKISQNELIEIKKNLTNVAHKGRDRKLKLTIKGKKKLLLDELGIILNEIEKIASLIFSITKDEKYKDCVKIQKEKIKEKNCLPSDRVLTEMTENQLSFYEFTMNNISKQKKYFNNLDTDNVIMNSLEKESIDSLKKQNDLEKNQKESYEDYIKKYFSN